MRYEVPAPQTLSWLHSVEGRQWGVAQHPDTAAVGHNPDGLRNAQVGAEYRLLTEEEQQWCRERSRWYVQQGAHVPPIPALQRWNDRHGWQGRCTGDAPSFTYRYPAGKLLSDTGPNTVTVVGQRGETARMRAILRELREYANAP